MNQYRPRPKAKKVKVTVVDDAAVPVNIDLEEELRARQEKTIQMKDTASSETDWKDKYLRLAADLDNTKKRLAQTYSRQAEQEKERLLSDFLEVADNLERALAHAGAESGALIEGVKTIQRQIRQILARYEVEPYDAKGQPFDPERHEAISIIRQPEMPPNTVAHVAQTGYTIGDRILRPARVIVSDRVSR